jgi:type II secretory pathway component PulF
METIASDLPPRFNLSPADAVELAAGVAQLTKAGLPLPAGLRALSEELPGRRLRAELRGMAARMERGDALEEVFNSASNSLPPHLHGLLVAGLRTGRLPEVMNEYVQVEQERRQLRQHLQTNLAYLTFLSIAVTVLAFFIQHTFLKEVGPLLEQLNGSFIGTFSIITWKMYGQIVWLSAGFSLFLLLMPLSLSNVSWMAWLTPFSDNLPFLGPLLRNLRLASFSRVTALLLENETPLPDAFRMAGTAAGDVYLARDCRTVASELERGRSLAESLADNRRFPRNWIPLIEWGQQTHALPQTFHVAAKMHDGRAKNQCLFIGSIFAPCLFLLIAGFICLAGSVIVMPAIANIEWWLSWRRTTSFSRLVIPPGFVFSSMFSPVLLGVALLASKRLMTLRRDPTNENIIEMGLSITGWVLIAVGLAGNLMLMMGLLSLLWIPIWIVVAEFIALKRQHTMQQALLGTMAVSAERFIPLAPAIEAFAEDFGGKFGVRAAKLASLLKNGVTLPDALRQVEHVVPRQLMPIIRVGYESGALAQGLSEAAAAEDKQDAIWGSFSAKMLYVAALPCLGSLLVLFMLVKILPAFQKIFKDFGTPLPPMTQTMMGVTDWAGACWPLLYAVTAIFGLLFLYGILRYLGVPLFDLPGMERLLRRQHATAIMDDLALAVEHNRPLYGVIQSLSECYPKKSIRRRLEDVRFDLEHGGAWCESLFRRGLIRKSDLAVLQAAERAGNLPWALREMADSNRRRLAYRLNVLVQLLFPPAVLCLGAMVLFIVVAMFLPLVNLIKSMS